MSSDTGLAGLARLLAAVVFCTISVSACSETPEAQQVVDRAVEAHGGDALDEAIVTFGFRGKQFRIVRDQGRFEYSRQYRDSTGALVREVLHNDGLYRTVDGERVPLSEQERLSVETDVNSVVYFALLPYPLNDPAVQTRYDGQEELNGEPYHRIEVSFRQEGGGRDYQDRFMYWFHRDRHTMDYLAYHYHTGSGGTRFREAINPRVVGGVRFADYRNYTSAAVDTAIGRYGELMDAGKLEEVSVVALDSVQVRPL